jgi:hypothetical protein
VAGRKISLIICHSIFDFRFLLCPGFIIPLHTNLGTTRLYLGIPKDLSGMIAFNIMSQQHLFDPQSFKGVDQKSRISFNRISATNLTKEKSQSTGWPLSTTEIEPKYEAHMHDNASWAGLRTRSLIPFPFWRGIPGEREK